MMEIITLAKSGFGAVQREVRSLVSSRLVVCTTVERTRTYQADPNSSLFHELCSMIGKTIGVPSVLQRALTQVTEPIHVAILYGSLAKGNDTALSDIDLLVVSDELSLAELFRVLEPAEQALGRKVSPKLLARAEFERARHGHFWSKVLAGKYVVLTGAAP